MSKRTRYPTYADNPARKSLHRLKFTECSGNSDLGTSNGTVATNQHNDNTEISSLLEAAMQNFYSMTYRDWINKYWHAALKPNLMAMVNESQRERAYNAFKKAVATECEETFKELETTGDREITSHCEHSNDDLYNTTSKFIFYAKNFEMRTVQKLRAVYLLDKRIQNEHESYGLEKYAMQEYGNYILKSSLREKIASETKQAILCSSISQEDKDDPIQIREKYYRSLVHPALVENVLRKFLDSDLIPEMCPSTFVHKVILDSVEQNTRLLMSINTIPSKLGAVSLSDLESNSAVFEYANNLIVPLVDDWLRRINLWTEFGIESLNFVHEISKSCDYTLSLQASIADRITSHTSSNLEGISEVLSIYAIQKSIAAPISSEDSVNPYHFRLPVSRDLKQLVSQKIYSKIVENKCEPSTVARKYLKLGDAISIFRTKLYEDDYNSFLEMIQEKLSESLIYADMQLSLASGNIRLKEAKKIVKLFNMSNQLSGYFLDDWEDTQYEGVVKAVAAGVLPKSIGGHGIDNKKVQNAYFEINTFSKDMFGLLPTFIIEDSLNMMKFGNVICLRAGPWMCSDDPSLHDDLPTELSSYVDQQSLLNNARNDSRLGGQPLWLSINNDLKLKWHYGWSSVKCSFIPTMMEGISFRFTCSVLQFEILKLLVNSMDALPLKKDLQRLFHDKEYVDNILTDLLVKCRGFLKTACYNGVDYYALDCKSEPNENLLRLRFTDKL